MIATYNIGGFEFPLDDVLLLLLVPDILLLGRMTVSMSPHLEHGSSLRKTTLLFIQMNRYHWHSVGITYGPDIDYSEPYEQPVLWIRDSVLDPYSGVLWIRINTFKRNVG